MGTRFALFRRDTLHFFAAKDREIDQVPTHQSLKRKRKGESMGLYELTS